MTTRMYSANPSESNISNLVSRCYQESISSSSDLQASCFNPFSLRYFSKSILGTVKIALASDLLKLIQRHSFNQSMKIFPTSTTHHMCNEIKDAVLVSKSSSRNNAHYLYVREDDVCHTRVVTCFAGHSVRRISDHEKISLTEVIIWLHGKLLSKTKRVRESTESFFNDMAENDYLFSRFI
jgi:hypothetical protein